MSAKIMAEPLVAMLVLSTAHVKERTAVILDKKVQKDGWKDGPPLVVYEKGEYGWIIPIIDEDSSSRAIPSDLRKIIEYAKEQGASWIMFDRDADAIKGLPVYDW